MSERKLLVINSFGPMASTLLAGLVEKLGFTNVPIRKLGLHQYLMQEKTLDCGYMEDRLHQTLIAHARAELRGGVSVLDRADQKPRPLLNYNDDKDRTIIDTIKAADIQDLYFQVCKAYCRFVSYKRIESNLDWQIELTTDIHRFNHKALYQAYQDKFDDVKMIHLHRDFKGWINSLASQAFVHPQWKSRIKFFPHKRYADYALYEEAVSEMPGLDLDFNDMFETPIEKFSKQLAAFLDVPVPDIDLRASSFDMYGKVVPYEKAFTPFDDKVVFLERTTQDYFDNLVRKEKIQRFPHTFISWVRYMFDMLRYRSKR